MGDLAVSFARSLNIPLVFTFHTQYEKYVQHYTPIASKLAGLITDEVIKRYLRNCEHVVVPTESVREMLAKNYGIERGVSVVPTPVDLVKFQDIQPEKIRASFGLEGKEVLLFVGRLSREKGLDMLLQAFILIQELRPGVRLLLLGRGPYEEALKAKQAKLGLKNLVIFAGAVPHEEVPGYYAAADLFVFPSTTETQGLVIIEAMAAGLPVVAVRAPGAVDVLTEGGGVLTENKSEAFAREVVDILADSGRQKELRDEALRAVERYSISDATARMLNAYETTLDSWENRGQER